MTSIFKALPLLYSLSPDLWSSKMYYRNLFVLDFVRRFFVSCAQIFETYAVRTLMKFGCDWREISHKSKCKKDSEKYIKRRWRDLNPRAGYSRPTAFRVRTLQPLGYISKAQRQLYHIGDENANSCNRKM